MSRAPRVDPLAYPGEPPDSSILLVSQETSFTLDLLPGRRLGQAYVELGGAGLHPDRPIGLDCGSLMVALLEGNVARVDERIPVLAVGSNASPAQLRHKFHVPGISLVMPLVKADVEGLAVGVGPDLSPRGYIGATPITGPNLSSELFVQWLDRHQLEVVDATEPGYQRVFVPAGDPERGGVRITLQGSGEVLGGCYAYVSIGGFLMDRDGDQLVLPQDHAELLRGLMARSERLRDMFRGSVEEWVERFDRETGLTDKVTDVFYDEGWVADQILLRELARAQEAPHGGPDGADRRASTPLIRYGQILPATSPADGTWYVIPSSDLLDRRGQAVVRVSEAIYERLGAPTHVAVQAASARGNPDLERLDAIAYVLVDPDSSSDLGTHDAVEVDEILRLAIGVETGEPVRLTPVKVRRGRWADRFLGVPLYLTCRVQLADVATGERNVCLLDSLTLDLLGVDSGDEVIIEGRADDDGVIEPIGLRAYAVTESVQEARETIHGGDFSARYPRVRDALGTHPDIPWVYIDSATRTALGLGRQKLAVVRIRPGRMYQLRKELREMLLVLAIAFLGLVELITHDVARVVAISVMVAVVATGICIRLRGRLSHRATQRRRELSGPARPG